MKIMFINSVVDYGSTGKIVRDLANGLKKEGHEVLICFGRKRALFPNETFYFGSSIGFVIHYCMSRLFGRHGLHSSLSTLKLISKIKKMKPDVISLHNIHGYYLNYAMLFNFLKKNENIRIVHTLHDSWMISGSNASFHFTGCKKWDNGCEICNTTLEYPINQFGLRQTKNLNLKKKLIIGMQNYQITVPSNWLMSEIQKSYLGNFEIEVVHNGINLDLFRPSKISKTNHKVKILSVSNYWNKSKGLYDLIKVTNELSEDFEFTIVGLEENQMSLFDNNVIKVSKTQNLEDLINYYQSADIFLNLSYEETLGMTTIESLASGTPAVVYNTTAIPEVIGESSGMAIEPGNVNAIIEAIKNFDFDKYNERNCLERAKIFSHQIMINSYVDLLSKTPIERGKE